MDGWADEMRWEVLKRDGRLMLCFVWELEMGWMGDSIIR
jgi:hypothetical protein